MKKETDVAIVVKKIGVIEKKIIDLEQQLRNERIKNGLLQYKIRTYQEIFDLNVLEKAFSQEFIDTDIDILLAKTKKPIISYGENRIHRYAHPLNIIFDKKMQSFSYRSKNFEFDLACIWGLNSEYEKSRLIVEANMFNVPICFLEEGFVESIVPYTKKNVEEKFRRDHSVVIDTKGLYIHAGFESLVEYFLNSNLKISQEELFRAQKLIVKIVENKISKYNHQPIKDFNIGEQGKEKVLVIDQVWGDQSIKYGMANEETFNKMLSAAVQENEDADIIVKTHPVTNGTSRRGYFQTLEENENIYKIDYDINPICLLEYVDKVYVCTSQMGFEALLCGKDVHVFGMPFYAGWGVTHDRQICNRRIKNRSVTEIFYMAYIMYSKYVSYKTNEVCEIEQVIQDILELREEYWSIYK